MTNAYVIADDSIKLPKEICKKLNLKSGMELKVLSDKDSNIVVLKLIDSKDKNFLDIEGVGKEIWECGDAQEYVDKERREWQ